VFEQCQVCPSCQDVPGATGFQWPTTAASGTCICETEAGWYFDPAFDALQPKPCDGDDDGWVRITARPYLRSPDAALRENARCAVRRVDRIVLRNEAGQEQIVPASDPWLRVDGALELFEPLELDDADRFLASPSARPAYGPIGKERALTPGQLNTLTKVCAAPPADYNGNGVPDIEENARSRVPSPWLRPFLQLGYFAELHRGWFEAPLLGDGPGRWIIEERKRCGGDFPLGYESEGDHWRQCARQRGSGYDRELAVPGYDFAQWSACPSPTGTCPAAATGDLETGGPDDVGVLQHGTCDEDTGGPDWIAQDRGTWWGMLHHSQFQCVRFAGALSDPPRPYERLVQQRAGQPIWTLPDGSSPHPNGERGYDWHVCELAEPDVDVQPDVPWHEPDLDCSAHSEAPVDGSVGWASVHFTAYDEPEGYAAGCVDECGAGLLDLCDPDQPAWSPERRERELGCAADEADFGRIVCDGCEGVGDLCVDSSAAGAGDCGVGLLECYRGEEPWWDDRLRCVLGDSPPDDELGDGLDANCDGFDGDLARSWFVSPCLPAGARTDADRGRLGNPFDTLAEALAALPAPGPDAPLPPLFLETGAIDGCVPAFSLAATWRLTPRVSIIGGITRSPDECPSGFDACLPDEPLPAAIRFEDGVEVGLAAGDGAAQLDLGGIVVRPLEVRLGSAGTAAGGFGQSSYGLHLWNVRGLEVDRCVFASGGGGDAVEPGPRDADASLDGSAGGAGAAGIADDASWYCGWNRWPAGGGPGDSLCLSHGGRGGRPSHYDIGFDAAHCRDDCPLVRSLGKGPGGTGRKGWLCGPDGELRAVSGGGRGNARYDAERQAGLDAAVAEDYWGFEGSDGANVAQVTPGAGKACFAGSGFRPLDGEEGVSGANGVGGGGGGGGGGGLVALGHVPAAGQAGIRASALPHLIHLACKTYGGAGGGGGGAGCGGRGGRGGRSGGGSFGGFIWDADVRITDCTFAAADGGAGTRGGAGAPGGLGGAGGARTGSALGRGAPYGTNRVDSGFELDGQGTGTNGGQGGRGGDGTAGARGGPGLGGPSIGLLTGGAVLPELENAAGEAGLSGRSPDGALAVGQPPLAQDVWECDFDQDDRCGDRCTTHRARPVQPCIARVRILDGPNTLRGRVQVYHEPGGSEPSGGRWSSICLADAPSQTLANALCQAMQVGQATSIFDAADELGPSAGQVPRLDQGWLANCAGHAAQPNSLTSCVGTVPMVGGCATEWGVECDGGVTP